MDNIILNIISEITGRNVDAINEETSFVDALKFDSLDFATLYVETENELGIKLDIGEFVLCKTVGEFIAYIKNLTK